MRANVRFWGRSGLDIDGYIRSLVTDAVEKGKNEPIKIFACAPVETGFS